MIIKVPPSSYGSVSLGLGIWNRYLTAGSLYQLLFVRLKVVMAGGAGRRNNLKHADRAGGVAHVWTA